MNSIQQRIALKAVIRNESGQVLLLREAPTNIEGTMVGKYTMPGGRLEPGEAWGAGIIRETKEETGLDVTPLQPVHIAEWRPVIHGIPHQIVAVYVNCEYHGGPITLNEEHDEYVWVSSDTWKNFDVADSVRDALAMTFA